MRFRFDEDEVLRGVICDMIQQQSEVCSALYMNRPRRKHAPIVFADIIYNSMMI